MGTLTLQLGRCAPVQKTRSPPIRVPSGEIAAQTLYEPVRTNFADHTAEVGFLIALLRPTRSLAASCSAFEALQRYELYAFGGEAFNISAFPV